MRLLPVDGGFALYKENAEIGRCTLQPAPSGAHISALCIAARWRRRGYGSYLLKEILRRFGGYSRTQATVFTAPLPQSAAEAAFWAKFGFVPQGGRLCRRRIPDLSAVQLAQSFIASRISAPALCVDATCGNGGDTEFLCRLAAPGGRVLGFDIQPAAIESTRARLAAAGIPAAQYELVCASHEQIPAYISPGTADIIMFNLGWLPGAQHTVYSTAQSSLPAFAAALEALRPGGVLSVVLYSGQVIGTEEKQAALAYLRGLDISRYTVLVCGFANWAETAPLPCFVIKK